MVSHAINNKTMISVYYHQCNSKKDEFVKDQETKRLMISFGLKTSSKVQLLGYIDF